MSVDRHSGPCLECHYLLSQFSSLSREVLHLARRGLRQVEFLESLSRIILDFAHCEAIEWWLVEDSSFFRCAVYCDEHQEPFSEFERFQRSTGGAVISSTGLPSAVGRLYLDIIHGHFDPELTCFTSSGTFFTGDARLAVTYRSPRDGQFLHHSLEPRMGYSSLVLIPLLGKGENIGFVQLMGAKKDRFTRAEVELFEVVAETFVVALQIQAAESNARERIKELTCLYEVVRLATRKGISLNDVLAGVIHLMPPAWQYPEVTAAEIKLDGVSFTTGGFEQGVSVQSAPIIAGGKDRGRIAVAYTAKKPPQHEGPFLKEERNLIDALARELAGIIERKDSRDERLRLESQIRHADRLATIGQLAAGVAHELNEPLATILGFAQLAEKRPALDSGLSADLGKIVTASLHMREIVNKLRIFARQSPARRGSVNLNEVVREGAMFIDARCAKQGIQRIEDLEDDLPTFTGDTGQLHQVFVNLAVNAVQAMPYGGTLTVRTRSRERELALFIEDKGSGMTEEVLSKIFMPFFTTKDIDQGTGLGLSVVHGIVVAHGGTIEVFSQPAVGTRFEIRLPRDGFPPLEHQGNER